MNYDNVIAFDPKTKKQKATHSNPDWYSKITTEKGKEISGAAALNYRIKAAGGMNAVIKAAGEVAAASVLDVLFQKQPKVG